jgi:hypothetical protein
MNESAADASESDADASVPIAGVSESDEAASVSGAVPRDPGSPDDNGSLFLAVRNTRTVA